MVSGSPTGQPALDLTTQHSVLPTRRFPAPWSVEEFTSADDGGSEDSRRSSDDGGRSSDDGSRSGHKDLGSTALVGILQWADHFEPWQSWPRPAVRRPQRQSVLFSS